MKSFQLCAVSQNVIIFDDVMLARNGAAAFERMSKGPSGTVGYRSDHQIPNWAVSFGIADTKGFASSYGFRLMVDGWM